MRLKINRNSFFKALSRSQSVVEKYTSVSILSHVLINAKKNVLILSSTDLEMSLEEVIFADIIEEGSVALPAQILYDLVRKFADGSQLELVWDQGDSQALISSGHGLFYLSCLPSKSFPEIFRRDLPYTFIISARVLYYSLFRCKVAMSSEETRYYLNGIYLHIINEKELQLGTMISLI